MRIESLFKKMFLLLISCLPMLLLGQSAFPTYPNTGDEAADRAEYAKAKAVWIQANPEAYKAMNELPTKDLHVISATEFANMPPEKQAHIKANPDKYVIKDVPIGLVQPKASVSRKEMESMPIEKAAYIKSHLNEYEITD